MMGAVDAMGAEDRVALRVLLAEGVLLDAVM
jgi:hypothetical protein